MYVMARWTTGSVVQFASRWICIVLRQQLQDNGGVHVVRQITCWVQEATGLDLLLDKIRTRWEEVICRQLRSGVVVTLNGWRANMDK